MSEEELADVLRACDTLPVEVYVVPRFSQLGVAPDGSTVGDAWGIPLIWFRRPARRRTARMIKRAFDLVVASVALLLSAPVLLAVAMAVRFSSPGPVLFRQLRIGQDGRPFELLKFRTMQVNDDSETTWSVADDARVTRPGARAQRGHPIPDRARFDNHYIEHWSLWRDVVVVVRTLANILLGK